MKIKDEPLLKALIGDDIYFHDLMNTYNIKLSIVKEMPSSILGFTYVSRRNNYHLVLNGNINYVTQRNTFIHELKHIVYDLPKMGYVIGLDMQYEYFEEEADLLAEVMVGYL